MCSEEVEAGTIVRHSFGGFSGDQALVGHIILQNWHVDGSGKSVCPVRGPRADDRVVTWRRSGVSGLTVSWLRTWP